ncbi:MAG: hypothetical protein ACKO2L_13845 [Planctomycetaceae bacterium]
MSTWHWRSGRNVARADDRYARGTHEVTIAPNGSAHALHPEHGGD